MILPSRAARRHVNSVKSAGIVTVFFFLIITSFFYLPFVHDFNHYTIPSEHSNKTVLSTPSSTPASTFDTSLVGDVVKYLEEYPIHSPYKNYFGELGRRTRVLRDLVYSADQNHVTSQKIHILEALDKGAASLYPFLDRSSRSKSALSNLRASIVPGSTGIVIPVGDNNVRFAAHLVSSLVHVLDTSLPIQIAYFGNEHLSPENRAVLDRVVESDKKSVEFLNLATAFNNTLLDLHGDEKAIKPFAVLASRFEKVILADTDTVFLQDPKVLFNQPSFRRSGALLFRGRRPEEDVYPGQQEWWTTQMKHARTALNESIGRTQSFEKKGDPGVAVIDKSRLDVLMGLLHVCWQNSPEVRKELTNKPSNVDEESWWMGFELSGSKYDMEKHYGVILEWASPSGLEVVHEVDTSEEDTKTTEGSGSRKICSVVVAHLDEHDNIIWYNGGLWKSNKVSELADERYALPDQWMLGGDRQEGPGTNEMGCVLAGSQVHNFVHRETKVLQDSIAQAKRVDTALYVDI